MEDFGGMHVVYASDRNYAAILGVSLLSLLSNNKGMEIHVHILDGGIDEEDRKKLENVCAAFGASFHRIPAENISRELEMKVACDRGSMAQFARIFIGRHLPEDVNRVLYLDCDTLIRKPLDKLWNLDLKGMTAAALADAFSVYYRKNIGLAPEDRMFNSGVLLIDMKKWRERKVEDRILAFIREKHGFIEKGDQGALNAVLSRECRFFSPVYNAVTIFFDFSYREMLYYRKPPEYYPERLVRKAAEDPAIVHYTLSFLSRRPWMAGSAHPWRPEWRQYLAASPWKNMEPVEEKRSWRVVVMRRLPRPLMLTAASFLQVYGRPLLYRLRMKRYDRKMGK